MSRTAKDIAQEIKDLLSDLSPRIEQHTAVVCPSCSQVCCRQEHGRLRAQDIAYLAALGEPVPAEDPGRDPSGPCRFLGAQGCTRRRWQRAWKCTWFFCDTLLRSITEGPQREARELTRLMNRVMELRELL
jgi:hypothetical protein